MPKASTLMGRSASKSSTRSLAGRPARQAIKGSSTAIRVFTGAVMPRGSNAVVLQEDVDFDGDIARTEARVQTEQNVRRRGQDVRRGNLVCKSGTPLTAYRLSWLAACGIERVRVKRRARVAVFSTGDELVEAGTPLAEGQIYDSNRFALLALLREKPVDTLDMGCLPDRPAKKCAKHSNESPRDADILVTSGGVSVGTADYVKSVVEEIGNAGLLENRPQTRQAVGRRTNRRCSVLRPARKPGVNDRDIPAVRRSRHRSPWWSGSRAADDGARRPRR